MTEQPPTSAKGSTGFRNLTKPLAILDSEWSDGGPATARIVSLAVTRHEPDGGSTSHYWVVNPLRPISTQATEVHGIRDEDVADKPTFREIAAEVAEVLDGCDLGGYGLRGDIELLENEMSQAGVRWSANGRAIIDGLRMWQVLEPRKLENAHERFVGPVPTHGSTHHAGFDVELTEAVIRALQGDRSIADIDQETNADMVDVAGKFRLDQGRRVVFAFGPYRGAAATDHPDYLQWMLTRDFAPSTREVTEQLLREYEESRNGWGQDTAPDEPAEDDDDQFIESDPYEIPF